MTKKLSKAEFLTKIAVVAKQVNRMHRFGPEFVEFVQAAGLPVVPEGYVGGRQDFPIYAAIVKAFDVHARPIEVYAAAETAWEFYDKTD